MRTDGGSGLPSPAARDHTEEVTVYTVLVTGSRDWTDGERIEERLRWAERTARSNARGAPIQMLLVHGACPLRYVKAERRPGSADMLADAIARRMGWQVQSFPAPWDTVPKQWAGAVRNRQMVAWVARQPGPKLCLAFQRGGSSGTSGCMAEAANVGIRVEHLTWA